MCLQSRREQHTTMRSTTTESTTKAAMANVANQQETTSNLLNWNHLWHAETTTYKHVLFLCFCEMETMLMVPYCISHRICIWFCGTMFCVVYIKFLCWPIWIFTHILQVCFRMSVPIPKNNWEICIKILDAKSQQSTTRVHNSWDV